MNQENFEKKLVNAYDKMMERINALLEDAEKQALPTLQHHLDAAKQHAIELKELTSEEADLISEYVRRDLHDAADYIETTGKELSNWFSFDLELVEDRLLELFAKVADNTRLELAKLASQAEREQQYHTGEIPTIGTLVCVVCSTALHFNLTSRIPPCPNCHQTLFKRDSH